MLYCRAPLKQSAVLLSACGKLFSYSLLIAFATLYLMVMFKLTASLFILDFVSDFLTWKGVHQFVQDYFVGVTTHTNHAPID